MSNPYDKMFDEDPTSGGIGKGSRLAHGLYDTHYNHHQRPRFKRMFVLCTLLGGTWYVIRTLAMADPVVQLAVQQSKDEEARRQKIIDSGMNYPVSLDL